METTNHLLSIAKGYISTIYLDENFNPIYVGLMNGGPDPNIEYCIAMSIAYTPNFSISEVYCFKHSSHTPFMIINGDYFQNRLEYLSKISADGIDFIKKEYSVQNPLYSDLQSMLAIAFIQSVPIDMVLLYNNTITIRFLQTNNCIEHEFKNTDNIALFFNHGTKVVEVLTSEMQGVKKKYDFDHFLELLNTCNHPFKALSDFLRNNFINLEFSALCQY